MASLTGTPTNYSGTTGYTYDYGQTTSPSLNRSQLTKETSTRGGYTNTFSQLYQTTTNNISGSLSRVMTAWYAVALWKDHRLQSRSTCQCELLLRCIPI